VRKNEEAESTPPRGLPREASNKRCRSATPPFRCPGEGSGWSCRDPPFIHVVVNGPNDVYAERKRRIERSASGEVPLWCARVLAKVPGTRAATYVLFTSFADTNSRIAKAAASRMKRTTTWDIHPPSTSISWKQNPA